jgi:hypothetical protein
VSCSGSLSLSDPHLCCSAPSPPGSSIADPDPGPGAFLTAGSRIVKKVKIRDPG